MRKNLRLLSIFGLIFIGLVCAWYYPVLISLFRPVLVAESEEVRLADEQTQELATNTLRFARLGINTPLAESAQMNPLNYEDWDIIREILLDGVALTYAGPSYQQAPTALVIGHSSDTYPHPYSAIFAGLGQTKINDHFQIDVMDDERNFTVVQIDQVRPNDTSYFNNLASYSGSTKRIALVTCWPPLTTRNRLVIVGEELPKTNPN